MEFKYCDRNGKYLKPGELKELAVWNPVMEHILAEVVQNACKEESGTMEPLVE